MCKVPAECVRDDTQQQSDSEEEEVSGPASALVRGVR
jgi:hypothetical protein